MGAGNAADIGGYGKTAMIYGLYSWSGAIRRRQSAIQHIGPDDVFLPSRYELAGMNAVLGMHAMGEAQDRPLWRTNRDNRRRARVEQCTATLVAIGQKNQSRHLA